MRALDARLRRMEKTLRDLATYDDVPVERCPDWVLIVLMTQQAGIELTEAEARAVLADLDAKAASSRGSPASERNVEAFTMLVLSLARKRVAARRPAPSANMSPTH